MLVWLHCINVSSSDSCQMSDEGQHSAKLLERLDPQCPAIIKIHKQSGGLILFPCSASSLIRLYRVATLCYSVWYQEAWRTDSLVFRRGRVFSITVRRPKQFSCDLFLWEL